MPILACVIKQYPIKIDDPNLSLLRQNKLRAWYFSSGISSRYSEGSDHKQMRDKVEMLSWFSTPTFDQDMPRWMLNIYGDINVSKSGAVGKTVVSLLNLLGPRDLYSDSKIVGPTLNDSDLHHVFPKAAMRKWLMKQRGIKDKNEAEKILKRDFNIDSVLNQIWLSSTTNREVIRDRMPSEYFQEIIENYGGGERGKGKLLRILAPHGINEICFDCLITDDYEGFIAERRNIIHSELLTTGHIKNIVEGENTDDDVLED